MTDNGNQIRPVRTLEVENFSVIRKAKLEFGRITVLVGPQARGKSLLCKLTYFLGSEVQGIAADSLLNRNSWDEFLETLRREFESRFVISECIRSDSMVSYSSQRYFATLRGLGQASKMSVEVSFNEFFRDLYQQFLAHRKPVLLSRAELVQELSLAVALPPNQGEVSLYIPSGRAFFVDPDRLVAALQGAGLDQITKGFAGQIAWNSRWKLGLLTTGRGAVQEIEAEMAHIADGSVAERDGRTVFLSSDGRNLPLFALSSGTSELLPMFNALNRFAFLQEHSSAFAMSTKAALVPIIYLEEPEAHVFPDTQRQLVNLFAWMANDPILAFNWVITTHSPYILTAFNTLIEAWRAGRKKEKHNQVAAIVDELSWVSEDDFAAYTIRDGEIHSIFQREKTGVGGSGLIDGDYLDSVSDQLGSEFDRLLDIEYAE